MKLIIDIPEKLAEKEHWYTDKEMWTVIKAAQNGTPLEQIRDEVNKLKKVSDGNKVYVGINDMLDIIDKYRGDKE